MSQELCSSQDEGDSYIVKKADVIKSRAETVDYQMEHARLIFDEGLSFSGFERNKVFINQEGMRFADISDVSGADSELDCRATLVADYDDDGDPDIFVNSIQRELHLLYRNDVQHGPKTQFVKVQLKATTGHPDAIGATVRVRTKKGVQAQVLSCGSGFESQNSLELIFGLGEENSASLLVTWPGGKEEDFGRVEAGQRCLLVEGTKKVQFYKAQTFTFKEPLPPGIKVTLGATLENLDAIDLEGKEHKYSLKGEKPILLNFWATTCISCVQEMPLLEKLHQEGKYKVVGVSLDPPTATDRIQGLKKKLNLTLPLIRVTGKQADTLFDLSRLPIPLTLILTADGKIEKMIQGKLREGQL